MITLVDALASRFVRRRLERNGTAGKFLAVSGRLAVRPLLILAEMTIRVAEHSYETVAKQALQRRLASGDRANGQNTVSKTLRNHPGRWGRHQASSAYRQDARWSAAQTICALLGSEPLLTQTQRRVAYLIPPKHTLVVVTRAHESFYAPMLADVPPQSVVVQPANRGTTPAILLALMRLRRRFHDGSVALFPSDHYVSDAPAFMSHVRAAFDAVEIHRQTVVLLGAEATAAETGYGWIEPGRRIYPSLLFRVKRFWEKPTQEGAQILWQGGSLWNTFVFVSRVSRLLVLIAAALPRLHQAFDVLKDALDTPQEDAAIDRLYAQIAASSFSDDVLSIIADSLAVLPLRGVEWSDIGEAHRVYSVLGRAQHGLRGPNDSTPVALAKRESDVIQKEG